jgi:hypothetical protein
MDAFLKAIPNAATSPYALVAYAIAALLMAYGGFRLTQLRTILNGLKTRPDITPEQMREIIEIATNSKVPTTITAEEWLKNNRLQAKLFIAAALIIAAVVIACVAIVKGNSDVTIHLPPLNPTDPFPLVIVRQGQAEADSKKLAIETYNFPVSDIRGLKDYDSFMSKLIGQLPLKKPIDIKDIVVFRYIDEKVVDRNNFDLLSNRNTAALIIPNDFVKKQGSKHFAFTMVKNYIDAQSKPARNDDGKLKAGQTDH